MSQSFMGLDGFIWFVGVVVVHLVSEDLFGDHQGGDQCQK